jgi:formylglycine-generating enzyme
LKFIKSMGFFFMVFIVAVFTLARQTEASARSVEIIVDFSESMNETIDDKSKIDFAREIAGGILDKISGPSDIGLTFYGHKEKDVCGDFESVVPVKGLDIQSMKQKLSGYKPLGKASADNALRKAADGLKGNNDYLSVVLITDGKKHCDGDILKTVREIKKDFDFRFIVYLVLLNPEKNDVYFLKAAAWGTYGSFFIVTNQKDISKSVTSVSELLNTRELYVPKTVRKDDMVIIPAGEFSMGSDDPIVDPIEFPIHTVYLDAFYIDTYEVTQKQYGEVMGDNPSFWMGSDLPVDSVSWDEAKTFCEKTGKRLPTEAEWEKAAKGGRNDKWAGTSELSKLVEYAWIHDTGANMITHSVGIRKPNGYGIHDMSGNVWEWVSDWYAADYYKTGLRKNPHGPLKGLLKILRGGNWDNHQYEVRTTSRYPKDPEVKFRNNGFRCAKSAGETSEKY